MIRDFLFAKRFYVKALTLAVVLGISTTSMAALTLEFDSPIPAGGTVSYGGAGGPMVGEDIGFDRVTGLGTPSNAGVTLDIVGGLLDFTTGANTLEGPALWTFAGGGSFVLTGSAYNGAAIPANLIASGTLLTGTFTTALSVSPGGVGSFMNISGFGIDSKHEDLLAFYGVADSLFVFANTEISTIIAERPATGGFRADVQQADISNSPVPEPATIAVWSGLIVIGAVVARRRFRENA